MARLSFASAGRPIGAAGSSVGESSRRGAWHEIGRGAQPHRRQNHLTSGALKSPGCDRSGKALRRSRRPERHSSRHSPAVEFGRNTTAIEHSRRLGLFPWQLDVLRYTAPRAARRATPPVNGRVTAMIPTRLPALQAGAGRSDRRYFPSASTSDFALSFMVLTVLL
jgi:hypothetical protein